MTDAERDFAQAHEPDFQQAHMNAVGAEAWEAVGHVTEHFSLIAARLRAQVHVRAMTREGAIAHLVANYRLTQVGAADILDNR
jgi:hypothetical protein